MSSSVVRLSSGQTIEVRTGVIQGIGPQGPIGPTGPIGNTGPQGAQGVPGPSGSVTEFSSEFNALAQNVTTGLTYKLVAFTQVVRDDLSCQASTTNFTLPVGSYEGVVWLQYTKQVANATNSRGVQILYNSVVIGGSTRGAAPTLPTDISVPFALKVTVGTQIFQVQTTHDEGATLSVSGRLWISRVGPGTKGDQGPVGATGATGPTGPTGATGGAGSIIDNTTTYATAGG